MPFPLVSLNFLTIASRATCWGPLRACHSVMETGPESVMSASVDCCGAGAAALHAALTSIIVARIVAFTRMGLPSYVTYASLSPPDARACDALHEVALGDEEEHNDGGDHESGRCHEQMVARPRFLPEPRQTDLNGPEVRLRGHDERPLERVPRAEEGDESGRDQRRDGERQNDAPEESKVTGAVDPGRVGELARDREEELAHEENREGARDERDDLHLVAVEPAQAREAQASVPARAHQHIVRNERRLGGDHQRRE